MTNALPPLGSNLKVKTIALSQPFAIHRETYTEIKLRQPSAKEYLEIGPLTAIYSIGLAQSAFEVPGAMIEYLRRCCVNVDPSVIEIMLADLPLEDGVRLQREFRGFFTEAVDTVLAEEAARLGAAISDVAAGAAP